MRSILYLWVISLKNRILELRKKPGVLVLYILMVGMIVGMIVLAQFSDPPKYGYGKIEVLKGLFFALVTMYGIYGLKRGLSSGGSFFEMSDVNFMFVSPLNPRVILVHGITRQIKLAFLAGFFILFQTQNLKVSFGLEFSSVLYMLLGFMVAAVFSETLAMFIYSFTNGDKKRQALVKVLAVLIFLPAILQFIAAYLPLKDAFGAFLVTINSWCINGIPAIGWATHGFIELVSGHVLTGCFFIGLTILTGFVLVMIIALKSSDYYEDVLCATETNFEKQRAAAEGNANAMASNRKIKVAKTGLWGVGASAFFGKHLRESFRENRLKLVSTMSFFTIAGAIIAASFMREFASLLVILQILMWMQLFIVAMGRGMKELMDHYIYMVPVNATAKLIWSNGESVLRAFIEAVILFTVAGVILGEGVGVILGCILCYTLFILLLLAINYLSMRIFKQTVNYGLLMVFYIFGAILIAAPGIVGGVIIGTMTNAFLGLLVLAAWEALAGFFCFYQSKDVLHYCDMITMLKK